MFSAHLPQSATKALKLYLQALGEENKTQKTVHWKTMQSKMEINPCQIKHAVLSMAREYEKLE